MAGPVYPILFFFLFFCDDRSCFASQPWLWRWCMEYSTLHDAWGDEGGGGGGGGWVAYSLGVCVVGVCFVVLVVVSEVMFDEVNLKYLPRCSV